MEKVKALDMSAIDKEYDNKWIAVSPENGEVVASGETLKDVQKKISSTKEKLLFFLALPGELNFAPLTA